MLRGLADGTPPLLVDDLHLQPTFALGMPGTGIGAGTVEVGLTVSAFRAAGAPAPHPP